MPGYPYRGRVLLRSAKLCPLGYYQGATIRVAVIDRRVNNPGEGWDKDWQINAISQGSAVVSSAEGLMPAAGAPPRSSPITRTSWRANRACAGPAAVKLVVVVAHKLGGVRIEA